MKELNGELQTLQHEFKEIKKKQQQRINESSNLTTTTKNLANEIKLLKNEFNSVQSKQREIISRDLNSLTANLTITMNDFANKLDAFDLKLNSTQEKQLELTSNLRDHGHGNKQRLDQSQFKLIDLQIKAVQQKQLECSRLSEENDQKINIIWTNLTDEIYRLDENLEYYDFLVNSTQKTQLKIVELTSQVTNFTNHFKRIDQQMETVREKQNQLFLLTEESGRKISALNTDLTVKIERLDD